MKQKLIDKLTKAGYKVDFFLDGEDCKVWTVSEPKKILFTNSIDEEFKNIYEQMYTVWYYSLKDYSIQEATMYDIEFYDGKDPNGNAVFSEIYLTEETAYQKSIEYAHSKGEKILCRRLNFTGDKYTTMPSPLWNWSECHYKLAPKPKYRAFTMEDDEVDGLLMVKIKSKENKARGVITNINNYHLRDLFQYWDHMDGTPIGKKIN
jgi:hypothetical protein